MALNEPTGGNMIYLSIMGGKLVRRFKNEEEGTTPRVNKNNVTVHEKHYPSLTGTLVKIFKREHPEYGDSLAIQVEDEGVTYLITMGMSTKFATDVLKKVPNIPFGGVCTFKPYDFKDEDSGRDNQGITITDAEGNKCARAYTKENPNGCPDLKKIKVKGKETWDNSEQLEFLLSWLEKAQFGNLPEVEDLSVGDQDSPF